MIVQSSDAAKRALAAADGIDTILLVCRKLRGGSGGLTRRGGEVWRCSAALVEDVWERGIDACCGFFFFLLFFSKAE